MRSEVEDEEEKRDPEVVSQARRAVQAQDRLHDAGSCTVHARKRETVQTVSLVAGREAAWICDRG